MEDFSTFLAARRPRDRTDQYLILSALYCLGGTLNGISSREITELLRLHLRKKAPNHIQTRLRGYSAYVRIASKGPPLLWILKDAGVQRLRELSSLSLKEITAKPEFLNDIGVICALEQPEFAAVEEAFGGADKW
jgi:hypothetical protein